MKRLLPLSALALLVACTVVTEPLCGCSLPGLPALIVTGLVTDLGEAPVAGAYVRLRLLDDVSCDERDGAPTRTARSTATGRFHVTGEFEPGTKCLRLWAEPPEGRALTQSEGRLIQLNRVPGALPDSLDVVLRLR